MLTYFQQHQKWCQCVPCHWHRNILCDSLLTKLFEVKVLRGATLYQSNQYLEIAFDKCIFAQNLKTSYLSTIDQEHTGHGQLHQHQNKQQDEKLKSVHIRFQHDRVFKFAHWFCIWAWVRQHSIPLWFALNKSCMLMQTH